MTAIDVVVPNFNYGRYLRTCVGSILEQQGVSVRVLIIDNASTDDSTTIARELAKDRRVELVFREENLGTHASFNQGIDWAEAPYFLLMFSDDFLVPDALKRAIEVLEKDATIAFCYGRDIAVYNDDPIPHVEPTPAPTPFRVYQGQAFIRRFCRQGVFQIPASSVIVRTDIQKRAGHYRKTLQHSDDYEIWLRLATLGSVAELNCIQIGLRTHQANRSRLFAVRQLEHIIHTKAAAESFFAHEGGSLAGADILRNIAQRGISARAYWSGLAHLARGDMEGLRLLAFAIRISPLAAFVPPIDYLLDRPDAASRVSTHILGLPGTLKRHFFSDRAAR